MKNQKILKKIAIYSLLTALCPLSSWATSMQSFSLPSLKGDGTINSSSYKGKVMIIDFWASWSEPSKTSFAAYNALLNKYGGKGLVIIAINADDSKDNALKFLTENPASFHVAIDSNKKVIEAYNSPTIPTAYVIDRSGNILNTYGGYHEGDIPTMEKEVEAALNK